MGIFTRKQRVDAPHHNNGAAADIKGSKHHHHKSREPMDMSRRPKFGQWLKVTLLDILTMIAMGAIGLGVYMAHPAPNRSFPITFSDGEIVYPEFAYPLRKEIIPIWAAAMLGALVPIAIILIMQIRIRSFWDVNNAVIGLLYSLICAAVFQVFLKWLIGGFRPHFLDVCKPDINKVKSGALSQKGYNNAGFQQLFFTREVCTGDIDLIDDSLESFPSGHTTAAFAGFVFLSIYLNAKLKVWSNYHPAMWKMIAIWAPILGATLIGGALTIDKFHNWYDVVAGAIIGTVMAFSAYRMTYASIWDWRINHIPLNRASPFSHDGGVGHELNDAMFTRKADWGSGRTSAHGATGHLSSNHNGSYAPRDSISRRPVGSSPARPDHMV